MKRLFWVAVGAGTGVWATRRVSRFVHSWSPQGVAARAVGAGDRVRLFADDVRTEMRAREAELREAVQMDAAPPEPPGAGRRRILRGRYTIVDEEASSTEPDKDGH